MGDPTDLIKFAEDAVLALDEKVAKREQKPRRYIGASGIGNQCSANLAFSLRGFPDTPPDSQLLRIFNMGHKVEELVVRDLRDAGFNVIEKDPMTGQQWHFEMLGGHVRCNLDGLMEVQDGTMWNVEIKSMNDSKWSKFKDCGVAVSHPHYYDQMQMQMAMSKTRHSFFVAYNKNNSRYHVEIVPFDDMAWEHLKTKIETALMNQAERISEDPTDWRCRGCFKRDACWNGLEVEPACHFCAHASAEDHNRWFCQLHGEEAVDPCQHFERYEPYEKGKRP